MIDKDAEIAADDAQYFIAKWKGVDTSVLSTSPSCRRPNDHLQRVYGGGMFAFVAFALTGFAA